MSYVVTPNYRNRDSEYKWLIREEGQPLESARACRRVEAHNAKFADSKEESGFGCSVVAIAEKAIGYGFEDEETRLTFNGRQFVTQGNRPIYSAGELYLSDDGGITAKL